MYSTGVGAGREEGSEWETWGKEKKREEESRESEESQRNNWIRRRERKSAAGRAFDKWPVYLAFTVDEAGCDDASSPLPPSLRPSLWGQAFWPRRPRDAIGRSLPKGGTSRRALMAFAAGSRPGPLSSSFIQHQKDIPSSWTRSRRPPLLLPTHTLKRKSETVGFSCCSWLSLCPCNLMVFPVCSSGSARVATLRKLTTCWGHKVIRAEVGVKSQEALIIRMKN